MLNTVVFGLAAASVVLGLLLGLFRGFSRALFRLLLLGGCVAGALLLKDTVGKTLMQTPFLNGETLPDYIVGQLPENLASLSESVLPVAEIVVGILAFLVLFLGLQICSAILFPILNLILRPLLGRKRFRLFGCLVGGVGGLLVAYALCVPVNGLILEVGKLDGLSYNGEEVVSLPENAGFASYRDGQISGILNACGDPLYSRMNRTESDGKTVILSDGVDTLVAAVKMADRISAMGNVDFGGGLSPENLEKMQGLLTDLDAIRDGMSEASLEELNRLLVTVAESFELPVDVSGVNLTDVSFSAEGELLTSLLTYEDGGATDTDTLVRGLAESDLVLPALANAGLKLDLDPEQKTEIADAINRLTGIDADRIGHLRDLFGIAG